MAAFLIDSFPTGNKESEGGGINMDNVTEELLNGFFCHYEPPTSEQAQFQAAREARANPVKYSRRPVAKPILKMSHLHPKNKKHHKGVPPTSSSVAATAGNGTSTGSRAGSSGKSVTWRDEQTNQGRSKVEKDVVGCAANYCGFFRQGEGLTDILMSPKEKAAAEKAGVYPTDSKTPPTLTAPPPAADTPVSSASSKDGSTGSSTKKRLTPILTSRNKKNKAEDERSPAASASIASSAYHPIAGKRILYDDLGNPIEEGDAYDSLEADENDFPATPGGTTTVADETPRSTLEDGAETVDTPTAEKSGATVMDRNNPLAFFCAVPTALMGSAAIAAASAAAAVGYKPVTESKQADNASISTTPEPSPSILRRPSPADRNTGVMAEYRDEMRVYEPMDYDNPFPHIPRDRSRSLQYRRVQSPPVRRRQPTPRRVRDYEDDIVYNEERAYYGQHLMNDGAVVSTLGKLPRQSTGTFDTSAARMSPGNWSEDPRTSKRGYAVSPSTITGASAYEYDDEDAMRRARPEKSPGRRSDVYSDLTMEKEYHRYQGRGNRSQATEDYEENAFMYLREEQQVNGRTYPSSSSRASSRPGRRSRGAVDPVRTRILLGEEEEEQLSPREYAERFRQIRSPEDKPQVSENIDRSLIIDQEEEPEESEEEENLSPRQYAEKYRKRRSAEDAALSDKVNALMDEDDNSGGSLSDKQQSKNSGDSSSKKSKGSSSKGKELSGYRRSFPGSSSLEKKNKSPSQKDPAPRGSIDPAEAVGKYSKQREQLPPTPRKGSEPPKDKSASQVIKSRQYETHKTRSKDISFFSKKELHERFEDAREALMHQFSPRSMATDDEIREEVSSVGMASDTIRPLYENPFMKVAPTVIEEQEQENVPLKQVQKKGSNDLEASTLSAVSGSTLSSKPSTQASVRSSQKKKSGNKSRSAPAVHESSSASTRSKKLWRGWKTTIGNVKKIVKEIDEQRMHPPHLSSNS
jgi:hypothetical protein